MCGRCEELEERVAWLESELGIRVTAHDIEALRRGLGLTGQEARIAIMLARANGRPVTRIQIEEGLLALNGGDECSSNLVTVYMAKLRQKLGRDAVRTAWGQGYCFSPEAVQRLRSCLEPQKVAA